MHHRAPPLGPQSGSDSQSCSDEDDPTLVIPVLVSIWLWEPDQPTSDKTDRMRAWRRYQAISLSTVASMATASNQHGPDTQLQRCDLEKQSLVRRLRILQVLRSARQPRCPRDRRPPRQHHRQRRRRGTVRRFPVPAECDGGRGRAGAASQCSARKSSSRTRS